MKKSLGAFSFRVSSWMEILAGTALVGVMLLIGADIVGRMFGWPVPGAYEIVSLAGGLVVWLALPVTSWSKGHVSTDALTSRLAAPSRRFLTVGTRLMGIAVFVLAGTGMVRMGMRLKEAGEVTAVLAFPFYPVAWAIGGAFFVQTLVLLSEIADALSPGGDPEARP